MNDIKAALIQRIENLRMLSEAERDYQISDIVDSLLSSRVSVTCESSTASSRVPAYNPETDGEYSEWLVSNNID